MERWNRRATATVRRRSDTESMKKEEELLSRATRNGYMPNCRWFTDARAVHAVIDS
jgi:hypothetical protein